MLRSSVTGLFAVVAWLLLVPCPVSAQLAEGKHDEFLRKFNEGRGLNDPKLVHRALKEYPNEAIYYFESKVDAYVHRSDNEAGNLVEEMRDLWKAAWDSELFHKIERFRAGLSAAENEAVFKLQTQERLAWDTFEAAKKSNNERQFRQAIDDMQKIAVRIDEIGDKLRAAKSWLLLVNIIEGFKERNQGDVETQVKAMERYLQLHEDWDWTKGQDYALNKSWYPGLKARLSAEPGKTVDKPEAKDAAGLLPFKPDSKWETLKLQHSVMQKPTEGISVFGSSTPLYWLNQLFEGIEPTELRWFKDGKVLLKRSGAAKWENLASPTAPPKQVKLGGNKKASEIWYEKQAEDGRTFETNFAFFIWTGGNQEQWCEATLNMEPQWRPGQPNGYNAVICMRSASYFTTEIEGVPVTFYDEDCNGAINDLPGHNALKDYRFGNGLDAEGGGRNLMMDSMQVGRSKDILPASNWIKINDEWYTVRVIGNNESIRYRAMDPARVKSGRIAMEWKGPAKAKPMYLVVRETSGNAPGAFFDVVSGGKKGTEVPSGRYEIVYGRIANGRAPKNMDAIIEKGESKEFEVKDGETYTLHLGAPLYIDCKPDSVGETITVSSTKMWVVDHEGVRYTSIIAEMLEPELVVAKEKTGKGAKTVGEWRRPAGQDLDELAKKHSVGYLVLAGYAISKDGKPSYEVSVKNPLSGPSFFGLQQKNHKLFGKLLPAWK